IRPPWTVVKLLLRRSTAYLLRLLVFRDRLLLHPSGKAGASFHNFTVRSHPAVARILPSSRYSSAVSANLCAFSVQRFSPVRTHHSTAMPACPVARVRPSGENVRHRTALNSPVSDRNSSPTSSDHSRTVPS